MVFQKLKAQRKSQDFKMTQQIEIYNGPTNEQTKLAFDKYAELYTHSDAYVPLPEELQDIELNAKGYLLFPQGLQDNSEGLIEVEIIRIDKKLGKVIITDKELRCKTLDIEEIKKTFLKSPDRYKAVEIRDIYRKMCKEPIDNFFKRLEDSKNNFPEIWL